MNQVIAFLAPKIIGGAAAPSPVGELGMVEMTQALPVADVSFEQIGPDMLVSGFLKEIPDLRVTTTNSLELQNEASKVEVTNACVSEVISFYKAWNPYGAFSNFSPHPVSIPDAEGYLYTWRSTEHFYQAQKFEGVQDTIAQQCVQSIQAAESPEEAARLGRTLERQRRDLVRSNWESTKLTVMYEALLAKFSSYDYLRKLLLSTIGQVLIEASPHDYFWGCGRDGTGFNHLGKLLMKVRNELQIQQQKENLNGSFMTSFQNHVP
ncbi:hypothetical protein O6H91_15G014500 [Diphasiastrum complanatum]|uniref:Uncharacterized protein n=1 Tax=Diphasiastrum complanatum TaxID=34168 RepID=A0ACC2BG69_DIPCM|nr:hypothetical protein O6H91_15G014500 [Diphasiastrum complanatum]